MLAIILITGYLLRVFYMELLYPIVFKPGGADKGKGVLLLF